MRCYEHIAIVHRGGASAARGAEFVSEGLRRGHRCCCVAPATCTPTCSTRLRELGVDVERHLDDRTLQFPPAAPDAGDLLELGETILCRGRSRARSGRPLAGRGSRGVRPAKISVPQFFELHARLNYLVKQYPSVALCQYDIEYLEIPDLFSAIAVHRHLLVEGTLVRDNPFYIPAEKFLAMSPEDREHDLRGMCSGKSGLTWGNCLSTLAGYGQL